MPGTDTRLDGARDNKQVWSLTPPMFEPEVFQKQMYSIEESTCDIVGPLRRPTQWFRAPVVIRRPGNFPSFAPLITPLPHAFTNCKAVSTPRPCLKH